MKYRKDFLMCELGCKWARTDDPEFTFSPCLGATNPKNCDHFVRHELRFLVSNPLYVGLDRTIMNIVVWDWHAWYYKRFFKGGEMEEIKKLIEDFVESLEEICDKYSEGR